MRCAASRTGRRSPLTVVAVGGTGVGQLPGTRVAYAVTDPTRGDNKTMTFALKPTGRNNRNIEITQTYNVDYGWDLLGRFAGLYVSRNVGDGMKLGLGRLSNMLAAVPNYDYAELSKADPAKALRTRWRRAMHR